METGYSGSMFGPVDPEQALGFVQDAIGTLEDMERRLPGMAGMEWRSQAADEFADVLARCTNRVAQARTDLQDTQATLQLYAAELLLAGGGDQ